MLSNVKSFIISRSGGGLTSFNKNILVNFSSEKSKMKPAGVYFFGNMLEKLQVKSCPRRCSRMKCLCWILSSFSTGSKQRASCRVLENQCGKKVVPWKTRQSHFYTEEQAAKFSAMIFLNLHMILTWLLNL